MFLIRGIAALLFQRAWVITQEVYLDKPDFLCSKIMI